MTAVLEITKRFHKDAQSREFSAALAELSDTIRQILKSGPAYHKQLIKPLSHTTKRNIWRIRVDIQPAPYRLFFEWVTNGSQPILRLVTFIPKKHRYCDPKHSAEIEMLSTDPVDKKKHAELEARILGIGIPDIPKTADKTEIAEEPSWRWPEMSITPNPDASETSADHTPVFEDVKSGGLLIEQAHAEELIEIFATRELIEGFATLHGFTPAQRSSLGRCTTTDDALAEIERSASGAVNRFIEFLLDQDAPNDLERFYKLRGDDFTSIAQRPLSSFMLAIDEEQQEAIDKPLGNRPFMVSGSAGTGKSIVCLYRLRRMVESRTNETLFDGEERPSYLFVTYTNSLVESSKALFEQISRDLDLSTINLRFETLDEILKEIAQELRQRGVQLPHFDRYSHSSAYWGTIRDPSTPANEKRLLEDVGLDFFSHEVDEVLVDRDVGTLNDYLEANKTRKELRRGLIIPLREEYRRAIWLAYQRLLTDVAKTGKATFSLCRKGILDALNQHDDVMRRFNVVIADEIQDLGETQLKLITLLAKSPGGLLLARDSGQAIYRRQASLSTIDSTFRLDSKNSVLLKRSYRMTRQIHEALTPLRNEVNRVRSNQEETAKPVYTGSKPRWLRADPQQHYRIIANDILDQIKTHGTHPGQFAVLFHTNEQLRTFHANHGERLATCVHNNRGSFSIDQPAVHLLTAHNAKGLEFPHVYLPHVISLSAPRGDTGNRFDLVEQVDSGIKLLYVAASRASSTLTILQEATVPLGSLGLLEKSQWICHDLSIALKPS